MFVMRVSPRGVFDCACCLRVEWIVGAIVVVVGVVVVSVYLLHLRTARARCMVLA